MCVRAQRYIPSATPHIPKLLPPCAHKAPHARNCTHARSCQDTVHPIPPLAVQSRPIRLSLQNTAAATAMASGGALAAAASSDVLAAYEAGNSIGVSAGIAGDQGLLVGCILLPGCAAVPRIACLPSPPRLVPDLRVLPASHLLLPATPPCACRLPGGLHGRYVTWQSSGTPNCQNQRPSRLAPPTAAPAWRGDHCAGNPMRTHTRWSLTPPSTLPNCRCGLHAGRAGRD
jgi:hypothetical protein